MDLRASLVSILQLILALLVSRAALSIGEIKCLYPANFYISLLFLDLH